MNYDWKAWLKKAVYDDDHRLHAFLVYSFLKKDLEEVLNYLKEELFGIRFQNQDDSLTIIPHEPRDWVKKTGEIYIDDIRKIKEFLSQRPGTLGLKAVFVMDAEKLNREAANAFLKILEEQPEYAFFFLFTQNVDLLPKTIISRLSKLNLSNKAIIKPQGTYNIQNFLELTLVDKFAFCDKFLYHKEKATKFVDELVVFFEHNLENSYSQIKELIRYKRVLTRTNYKPQIIIKDIILNVLEKENTRF